MKRYVAIVLMGLMSGVCVGQIADFSYTCPQPSVAGANIKTIRGDAKDGDYIWGDFMDQNHTWYYAGYNNMPGQASDAAFVKATLYKMGGFLYCTYQWMTHQFELKLADENLTDDQLSKPAFRPVTSNTWECNSQSVKGCKFATM